MPGLMRIPIWPCENDWEGSRKAEEGGSRGPDTKEVSDTLANTVLSYLRASRPQGVSPIPGVGKVLCEKLGMVLGKEEYFKTFERLESPPQTFREKQS